VTAQKLPLYTCILMGGFGGEVARPPASHLPGPEFDPGEEQPQCDSNPVLM
jgi:hypothetical protein